MALIIIVNDQVDTNLASASVSHFHDGSKCLKHVKPNCFTFCIFIEERYMTVFMTINYPCFSFSSRVICAGTRILKKKKHL